MPGAAALETQTEQNLSRGSIEALLAVCVGLLSETMSSDAVYLAMARARKIAEMRGVPPQEFNRVLEMVMLEWKSQKSKNPLSSMFT